MDRYPVIRCKNDDDDDDEDDDDDGNDDDKLVRKYFTYGSKKKCSTKFTV
jgi:hypothetical protein